VLQKVLGPEKVTYHPLRGLGFIRGCTKYDLGDFGEPPSASFAASYRFVRRTALRLHFTSRRFPSDPASAQRQVANASQHAISKAGDSTEL
jgi:hypothetical protein